MLQMTVIMFITAIGLGMMLWIPAYVIYKGSQEEQKKT